MSIVSAIYTTPESDNIKVTYDNGNIFFVPVETGNRHYQEVLAWGGTIDPYVEPPPAPALSNEQKLENATGLTIEEIKEVLGIEDD